MDFLYQSVWFWLVYLLVMLFVAAAVAVVWRAIGPGNLWCGLSVAGGTWGLTPALCAPAVVRRVPRHWFRVPAGERVLHRIVGVGLFGWLLDLSGWNRLIKPLRGFSGSRASLLSLEQSARSVAAAHGLCFAIHVVLAIGALFSRHPLSGALWMLAPGVVVHFYPVLVQRALMLRLQPLLDRPPAAHTSIV
jgi:hypothetical protein